MRSRRIGLAIMRIRTVPICAALACVLTILQSISPREAQSQPGYSGPGYAGPAAAPSGGAPLPLFATRQTVFAIPFTVDRRVVQPVEVHLYVSVDQGTTWQLHSRQAPSTRQFTFRAQGDREYWFSSRTLDGAQQAQSQGPLQPELRVVVDTVPPQLEFTARPGEGGEVITSWQVFDQNLLASSLKVEYQEGVAEPWKPVAVQRPDDNVVRTQYQSQMTWWPETQSPTINIRAEVRDRAGNLGVVNRRLLLPSLVTQRAAAAGGPPPRPADPFARQGQRSEGAVPWPSDHQPGDSRFGSLASDWGDASDSRLPVAEQDNAASSGTTGFAAQSTALPDRANAAFPASRTATPAQPTAAQSGELIGGPANPANLEGNASAAAAVPPSDNALSAAPSAGGQPVSPAMDTAGAASFDVAHLLPAGERPQMTNSPRFRLDYDVDAVGPAGVAEVQLWATPDGGRTWRLWGTDDDLQSPFDVVVEQDGIFGFHVVVVGRNGMSGRKPRTGDLADVWVGVDTTPPTAQLTSATYGDGAQTGKLLIQWQATDQLLDAHPVTLSFSESAEGPWTAVASSLPNTGQFAWTADPQLPPSVFLRLEVRDAAGNVTSDQTSEPVLVDGLAPKARIRGILPVQELDREAFRHPRRG